MNEIGRGRRWTRFTDAQSSKALIVPIDHGLTLGPIHGLHRLQALRPWLESGAATGVIMHKGLVEKLGGLPRLGLMVHLNGAVRIEDESDAEAGRAPDPKPQLTSVDTAVRLGADGVSMQLDVSRRWGSEHLCLLSEVVEQAHGRGLPVLAMVYDKTEAGAAGSLKRLRHFMRAAIEVGADVLKVLPPADLRLLPELLDGIQSDTPVLFAGGSIGAESDLLALAKAAVESGAAGLCVGRNVFQRSNPAECLARVASVLHQRRAPRLVSMAEPAPGTAPHAASEPVLAS
jgi:fructose-bisphosphate aldolase, class I